MASQAHHAQHLDATDREVVYCHACAYEWYRVGYGLQCPSCQSDITEIVSVENDPRQAREDDSDDSDDSGDNSAHIPEIHGNYQDQDEADDSDPEVADIDEHMDPNGFGHSDSTQAGEGADHFDTRPRQSVERFLNVMSTIGMPFTTGENHANLVNRFHEASQNGGGRVEWANETSQGSVTFYSPDRPPMTREHGPFGFEPFSTLFTSAFRDFGVQLTGETLNAAGEQSSNEGVNLASNLANIISMINNGVHGDVVYSQAGLDRVISSLMMDAANTPSLGGAPPASDQGLADLPRRTVDEDLRNVEGNTDCTICIDGMKVGEVVVTLPCSHLFHEECVVLWLKQHNTCPVCRAPIEQSARRATAEYRPGPQLQQQQNDIEHQQLRRRGQLSVPTPSDALGDGPAQASSSSTNPSWDSQLAHTPPPFGSSRPPNQSQTRLNEAMRYLSSQQGERDGSQGPSAGFSYDTSRLQRRSSMSPTSPRVAVGEGGRSMRERSPSQSSRRTGSGEGDQSSNTGSGPMRWLRGRFVGGGSQS